MIDWLGCALSVRDSGCLSFNRNLKRVSLHSPQLGNIHKQEVLETSLVVLNLLSSLKIRAAVLEANMRQAGKRVPNMTEFVE